MRILLMLTLALAIQQTIAQFSVGAGGLKIPPINLITVYNMLRREYYKLIYPDSLVYNKKKKKYILTRKKDEETLEIMENSTIDDQLLNEVMDKLNGTCVDDDEVCEERTVDEMIEKSNMSSDETDLTTRLTKEATTANLNPETRIIPAPALLHTPEKIGFSWVWSYSVLCLTLLLIFLGISVPYFLRGHPNPEDLQNADTGGVGGEDMYGGGENDTALANSSADALMMMMMMNYTMSEDYDGDEEMEIMTNYTLSENYDDEVMDMMMNDTMPEISYINKIRYEKGIENMNSTKTLHGNKEIGQINGTRQLYGTGLMDNINYMSNTRQIYVIDQNNTMRPIIGNRHENGLDQAKVMKPGNNTMNQRNATRKVMKRGQMNSLVYINNTRKVNVTGLKNDLEEVNSTRLVNRISVTNNMEKKNSTNKNIYMNSMNVLGKMNENNETGMNQTNNFGLVNYSKLVSPIINANNIKMGQMNDMGKAKIDKKNNGINSKGEGQKYYMSQLNGRGQILSNGQYTIRDFNREIAYINQINDTNEANEGEQQNEVEESNGLILGNSVSHIDDKNGISFQDLKRVVNANINGKIDEFQQMNNLGKVNWAAKIKGMRNGKITNMSSLMNMETNWKKNVTIPKKNVEKLNEWPYVTKPRFQTTGNNPEMNSLTRRSGLPQTATRDVARGTVTRRTDNLMGMNEADVYENKRNEENRCIGHVMCLRHIVEKSTKSASDFAIKILKWIPGIRQVNDVLNHWSL